MGLIKKYFPLLVNRFAWIAALLVLSIAVHSKVVRLPNMLVLSVVFLTYAVAPGYMFLLLIERDKQDAIQIYANSLFLSMCLFAPLAFIAFLAQLKYPYLVIIYDSMIAGLILCHIMRGRLNPRSELAGPVSSFFSFYLAILAVILLAVSYIGYVVSPGGDVAHIMAYVRKLAESPYISPFSPLKDYDFVNYSYSYNSYLLFLSLFANVSHLDLLFVWNYLPAPCLLFTIAACYTFVLYLTRERSIAIFVSLFFPFVMFGTSWLFEYGLFRGYIVLPSIMVYPLVLMGLLYPAKALIDKKTIYIIAAALGSFLLFSTHGQGIFRFGASLVAILMIHLFFRRKDIAFWKSAAAILLTVFVINLPYLYLTKLKTYHTFEYVKPGIYQQLLEKKGPDWKNQWVYFNKTFFIISPKFYIAAPFLIAIAGVVLFSRWSADRDRKIFFVGCVLAQPFILLNPFVNGPASKYLGMGQIWRYAETSVFINVAIAMAPALAFATALSLIRKRAGEKGLAVINPETTVGWLAVIFPLLFLTANFGAMKNSYTKMHVENKGVYPLKQVLADPLYKYLKNNIPGRSTIFNLKRHYYPVTVVSNNFVTFPGKLRKHYANSPQDIAERDFANQNLAREALLKKDFDLFFKIFNFYHTDYLLLSSKFNHILKKNEYFNTHFDKLISDNKFTLYQFDGKSGDQLK